MRRHLALLGRVPLLVMLLLVTSPLQRRIIRQVQTAARWPWGAWLALLGVVVLFVAAALLGRTGVHPWWVLAVEVVVAAPLAFIPVWGWLTWFGINDLTVAVGATFPGAPVRTLGLVWVVIVAWTAARQIRVGRDRTP